MATRERCRWHQRVLMFVAALNLVLDFGFNEQG